MNYYKLLQKQAAAFGSRLFLQIDAQSISYQALLQRVDACAAALPALQGDVLANAVDVLSQAVLFFALQKCGCRPILLHHGLSQDLIRQIAQKNHLQALVCWKDSLAVQYFCAVQQHEAKDCLGVLSSGSTGTPKVMYRTFESWAGFFPEQNRIFGIQLKTNVFLQGNLSFTGNMNAFLSVLYAGGSVITSAFLRWRRWAELLQTYQVEVLYLVPAKLRLLLGNKAIAFGMIKTIFTGSQLLDRTALERLQLKFPAAKILLYYGASELNYITYAVCKDAARDPMNLGKPFPGVQVAIQDGLVYVTTDYHISGICMPYTVGDTGYMNEQGDLIFTGRRQNWVNKGGFKISCTRVELALQALPGVQEACVMGYDDKARGSEIAAFIVPESSGDEKRLRHVIRQALPKVEVPGRIVFLPELPLNDRGKIEKAKLRACL